MGAIFDLAGAPGPYSVPTVGLEGESLELVGARGDELSFYLTDFSPSGHWAAPGGLRLELGSEDTAFRTSAEAIAPRQKDWEDPVFYTGTQPAFKAGHNFEIRGSFTVPDVPSPETQTLTGRLRGEFLYPGTEVERLNFTTTHLELDILASLEVVSAEEAERLRSDYRAERWGMIGLGILYTVVGLGYALSYGMGKDREQTRRLEPYLTLALGVAVWASFAALWWLKPFGE